MTVTRHLSPVSAIVTVVMIGMISVAMSWGAKESQPMRPVPAAVLQAVRRVFPQASIEEMAYERRIVRLIEVAVVEDGHDHDVLLSEDGVILSIKQPIPPDELPNTVRQAVEKLTADAKIQEAERVKVLAELRAAPIDEPRVEYEIDWRWGGREQQATVSEDGTPLKTAKKLGIEQDR